MYCIRILYGFYINYRINFTENILLKFCHAILLNCKMYLNRFTTITKSLMSNVKIYHINYLIMYIYIYV